MHPTGRVSLYFGSASDAGLHHQASKRAIDQSGVSTHKLTAFSLTTPPSPASPPIVKRAHTTTYQPYDLFRLLQDVDACSQLKPMIANYVTSMLQNTTASYHVCAQTPTRPFYSILVSSVMYSNNSFHLYGTSVSGSTNQVVDVESLLPGWAAAHGNHSQGLSMWDLVSVYIRYRHKRQYRYGGHFLTHAILPPHIREAPTTLSVYNWMMDIESNPIAFNNLHEVNEKWHGMTTF